MESTMPIARLDSRRYRMNAAAISPMTLSRRGFLGATLASGFLSTMPVMRGVAADGPHSLLAGTRTLEINGRAARVYSLIGPGGRPGIRIRTHERFRVALTNQSGQQTLVHWHGQLPPWTQDGFPWPETPPLGVGEFRSYDYAPTEGTYWMHSHVGMQEQGLMTAPLIVEDKMSMRDDRQEIVLVLHDFTFRTPDEVLAGLTHPTELPRAPTPHMDVNDVDFDAFLANDRTLSDPEIVRVERGGRIRLRIINGASSSQFWIDLGGLTGRVVAVDGHAVNPVAGQRFPMAMAQRLDLLIDLPNSGAMPILAQLEGSPHRTGIVLATPDSRIPSIGSQGPLAPPIDLSLETRLTATDPLRMRPADLVRTVSLDGGMKPYAWSMNGERWPNVTPLST